MLYGAILNSSLLITLVSIWSSRSPTWSLNSVPNEWEMVPSALLYIPGCLYRSFRWVLIIYTCLMTTHVQACNLWYRIMPLSHVNSLPFPRRPITLIDDSSPIYRRPITCTDDRFSSVPFTMMIGMTDTFHKDVPIMYYCVTASHAHTYLSKTSLTAL